MSQLRRDRLYGSSKQAIDSTNAQKHVVQALFACCQCMYHMCQFVMSLCVLCPVAMHKLGECLLKRGELDEAEEFLKRALNMKTTACSDDKASISES